MRDVKGAVGETTQFASVSLDGVKASMTATQSSPRKIHEGDANIVPIQETRGHDAPIGFGPANINDAHGPSSFVHFFHNAKEWSNASRPESRAN